MHYCVGVATVVVDVHTNPHVNPTEYMLLILLVLAGHVEKHSVQKIFLLNRGKGIHLAW